MSRKIATVRHSSIAEAVQFARERHRMILTTFRRDGSPQSSPVTGGIDEQGRVVIASYPERAKSVNLRRNPAASVLVLSDAFNDEYVQLDGQAEVIGVPAAVEPLVEYFRAVAGEHSDWDEYRQAMLEQGKCLIRITVQRAGPIATGGFPARLA